MFGGKPHLSEQKIRLMGAGLFSVFFVAALIMFLNSFKVEWLFKAFYLLIVVIIFASRKDSEGDDGLSAKSFAIYAHCLVPLFATKGGLQLVSATLCGLIILTGLMISTFALTDLWDAFGIVPANRGVVKRGLYGWIRHPIYLGYCVAGLGVLLFSFSLAQLFIFILLIGGFIYRIKAEETLLEKDASYRDYQTKVRYQLLTYLY